MNQQLKNKQDEKQAMPGILEHGMRARLMHLRILV